MIVFKTLAVAIHHVHGWMEALSKPFEGKRNRLGSCAKSGPPFLEKASEEALFKPESSARVSCQSSRFLNL